MGDSTKITPPLRRRTAASVPEEIVDVVVELAPGEAPAAAASATRADRMAALDRSFRRRAEPVENAIKAAGGTVVERLWINDCLRARVPVAALGALAGFELVSSIDTPHALTRER